MALQCLTHFHDWLSNTYAIRLPYVPLTPYPGQHLAPPTSVYEELERRRTGQRNPRLCTPCLGPHLTHNAAISTRVALAATHAEISGWPSRGGVIILEHAFAPDFDFLGLNALDPPLRRDADQAAEDAFCQKLLRLGATWWENRGRRRFLAQPTGGEEEACEQDAADEALGPTQRECSWVRVAWPKGPDGELCVLTCEEPRMGSDGRPRNLPRYHGLIAMARTMEERFEVLKHLGGVVYESWEDFQDSDRTKTFLKAWEDGYQGERGYLKQEKFINPAPWKGHPDEALGRFVQD